MATTPLNERLNVKIFAPLACIALSGATVFATPALSHAVPTDPPVVKSIKAMTINGSGCQFSEGKPTEVKVDGNSVSITNFSGAMISEDGAGVDPSKFRVNCAYVFDVDAPEGYTYAIGKMTLAGSAYIEEGAKGVVQGNVYFQGESQAAQTFSELKGKHTGEFISEHDFPAEGQAWAPCGAKRLMIVNISSRVNKGTQSADAYSWIRQDEPNGVQFTLNLKKC